MGEYVEHKVTVWAIEVYRGKRGNTYYVRWKVGSKRCKEPFKTGPLADSFRSKLVLAQRAGEGFDRTTGLPASMATRIEALGWYEFACAYIDMKWPDLAATTRRTQAEAMTAVTMLMLTDGRGKPPDKLLRAALTRWAFNTKRRDRPRCPARIRAALRWVKGHTRLVSALAEPDVLRAVLSGLKTRLDGKPYATSVASRRRKILNNAVGYAIERKLLAANPIPVVKGRPVRSVHAIDRRCVPNPVQARTLLHAVGEVPRSGLRLKAFFGCLYYAGMRPEEVIPLAKPDLASIPRTGWGEFHLGVAEPYAGKDWTDTDTNRDRRNQLKQREPGEGRTAPCPPELTELIWWHVDTFGFGPDGRLFVGERNGEELPKLTILRIWKRARALAFVPEVVASPLALTPYDLRHAAVSTWLNSGVPPTDVAQWAGQSVEILLRIYAKCLDQGVHILRQRVENGLGYQQISAETSARIRHRAPETPGANRTQPDIHDVKSIDD